MKGVLKPFTANSWLHPVGARRKAKELMERMPNLRGCLAVTLTFDPERFEDPGEAFEKGNDRIRRIKDRLKKGIPWEGETIRVKFEYLRKLEFHKSGWPHFHVILKTRRYIDVMLLNHLWGYGLVKVQKIQGKTYPYFFKYLTKSLGDIPEWVRIRPSLRPMQSSRNFFPKKTPRKKTEEELLRERERRDWNESKSYYPREKTTIGERLEKWERMGMFQSENGHYTPIELIRSYNDFTRDHVMKYATEGKYLGRKQFAIESTTEILQWMKTVPKSLRSY